MRYSTEDVHVANYLFGPTGTVHVNKMFTQY